MKTIGTERELAPNQITGGCGHCQIQWGSTALAHCKGNSRHSGCGETFSSDSAFNLHRSRGVCKTPTALVNKETGAPRLEWDEAKQWWRFPGKNDSWS
jgi:hypothetical protein